MLRSAKSLLEYKIRAIDGTAGTVHDVYFDDSNWNVRHLAVDTGVFLWRHRVLLSPHEVGKPDWVNQTIATTLTRDEVKARPRADSDKPVFRQMQDQMRNFSEWAPQWTPVSGMPEPQSELAPTGDTHLHSIRHLLDGHLTTSDGVNGHVIDFIVDDGAWHIEMIAVEMDRQLRMQTLAIPVHIISDIPWDRPALKTNVDSAAIMNAPEYNPLELASGDYAKRVRDFLASVANFR